MENRKWKIETGNLKLAAAFGFPVSTFQFRFSDFGFRFSNLESGNAKAHAHIL
jgi:hypothetical protein